MNFLQLRDVLVYMVVNAIQRLQVWVWHSDCWHANAWTRLSDFSLRMCKILTDRQTQTDREAHIQTDWHKYRQTGRHEDFGYSRC